MEPQGWAWEQLGGVGWRGTSRVLGLDRRMSKAEPRETGLDCASGNQRRHSCRLTLSNVLIPEALRRYNGGM